METTVVKNKLPTVILTKEQEVNLFKSLIRKTYKEAGYEFGLHLMYPNNDVKIVSVINVLVKRMIRAPELWGLSQDVVDVVKEAIESRSIRKGGKAISEANIQEESFRDKLDVMRDTVAEIISKKLKKYNTAKGVDEIAIRDLKDLLAMTIDKSRLLRGESTENIKKLSVIDTDNMNPKDALTIVMKAREALIESKK